jgi:sulfite exporter TauE/SafE
MVYINLWNPQNVSLISAFIISYLLGIVHGITPDEHTWPITFSYSVGTFSSKGGAKTGLVFSSGFTAQRAILSELSYLALAGIFITAKAFGITYIVVGLAMALAGIYIARKGKYLHWHFLEEKIGVLLGIHGKESKTQKEELEHKINPAYVAKDSVDTKPVPVKLALIHGFVAGFGFGAFALIIYTVLAPSMPSIYLGFLPGLLFGLGTMTMQIIFGTVFGTWLSKMKNLTQEGIAFVGKTISTYVLQYGGISFIVAGAAILAFPEILSYGIITPLKVHNLHDLGIGFFLVIIVVVVIGILGYRIAIKKATYIPNLVKNRV